MGWLYKNKPKFVKVMDFLKQEFNNEYCEVIDGSVVKYRTAYLACRSTKTGEVFGLVCLLNYRRGDLYNFGYKDMEESMLPFSFDCPKRILSLLTEPMNEEAKAWRAICKKELTLEEYYIQKEKQKQIASEADI